MMRIESVAAQPDRAGRHAVRFTDGTVMRLYRQTVEDFCLYPGLELDEAEMKKLKIGAGEMSAKMRAVRIVTSSSVSKQELERRLVQKGEDPAQAKQAVDWMSELHLVDDLQTAHQIVSRCVSKGYGLARAKQTLFEKRIPREFWQEALQDYPDQMDAITGYLQTHLKDADDPKQLRKAVDALLRKGHSYGHIRKALDRLSVISDDFPEDN